MKIHKNEGNEMSIELEGHGEYQVFNWFTPHLETLGYTWKTSKAPGAFNEIRIIAEVTKNK